MHKLSDFIHLTQSPAAATAKSLQSLVIKAGEVLKINADVAGRPLPILSWAKDGVENEERARTEIVSTDYTTLLTVKDCVRRDSGQYVLTVKNVAGTRSMMLK